VTIDTHHHFWTAAEAARDLPDEDSGPLRREATPEQLREHFSRSAVRAGVLVQSANSLEHTRGLLDTAGRHDIVAAVAGWIPLHSEPAARQALDELGGHPALRGVRHLAGRGSPGPEPDPERSETLAALRAVADRGLAYDIVCVHPRQLRGAARLARRIPELTVVIDHLGRPPVEEDDPQPWSSALAEVARCPNTAIKVSPGIHLLRAWRRWEPTELAPYVERARDLFGPERMMLASNWPMIRLVADYADVVGGLRDLLAGWSAHERDAVLSTTARRVYAIDDFAAPPTAGRGGPA
jgi:L-fuconolactonase